MIVGVLQFNASLDPECREALAASAAGKLTEAGADAIIRHLDPAVQQQMQEWSETAQKWVAENADCLECGHCCQQGWRVDVRQSDLDRMSPATQNQFVDRESSLTLKDAVGVMRLVQIGESKNKKCAAQTAFDGKGCSVYEERPEPCRTFNKGHERCVLVRLENGLTVGSDPPKWSK
jgi:Fe-S-cluster containining protein